MVCGTRLSVYVSNGAAAVEDRKEKNQNIDASYIFNCNFILIVLHSVKLLSRVNIFMD